MLYNLIRQRYFKWYICFTVRLVNGGGGVQGRVEVLHDNEWGTVCDDMFGDVDAEVVCRQLGYFGGRAMTDNEFGEGSGTIWLDSLECRGSERDLGLCGHSDWGHHDCDHSEDVGVVCGKRANEISQKNSTEFQSCSILFCHLINLKLISFNHTPLPWGPFY